MPQNRRSIDIVFIASSYSNSWYTPCSSELTTWLFEGVEAHVCMCKHWSRLNTAKNTNSITSCKPWITPTARQAYCSFTCFWENRIQQYHASIHCLNEYTLIQQDTYREKNNLTTLTGKPLATRWHSGSHRKYECGGHFNRNLNQEMFDAAHVSITIAWHVHAIKPNIVGRCYHHVRPFMGLGQHVSAHPWRNNQNILGDRPVNDLLLCVLLEHNLDPKYADNILVLNIGNPRL